MLRKVSVRNGKLKGLPGKDPRVTVYKGIPFASAPIGENRWRAPMPCKDWDGELQAFEYGPISIQDTPGLGTDVYCREWHVDPDIPMSEDCLYLNVWTPAKSSDEKLPVLVWIFGGGFQWGYTAEMEFDGERLARRGIIVVSINYRLGVFGFLTHPEIAAESPNAPCNFGLLDQKAGLQWVYENIASFGGDPENITIAGQSAGGASVLNQMAAQENFPIIKGAVVMSGMIRFPGDGDDILKPVNLERAKAIGGEFFDFLGVRTLEEARALDALYIRDKYGEWAQIRPRVAPVIDGITYKDDPLMLFEKDMYAKVPVLTGYTSDEFDYNGIKIVKKTAEDALRNNLASGGKAPKFLYEFAPDIPGWDNPGVFHSVDLWFWFETLGMCWRPLRGRHHELARQMSGYLANFVKAHDPNGKDDDGTDLPLWKPVECDTFNKMNFTSEGAVPDDK